MPPKKPSTSLIWDKKALPRPSPFAAPGTKPAISTIFNVAYISRFGLIISQI